MRVTTLPYAYMYVCVGVAGSGLATTAVATAAVVPLQLSCSQRWKKVMRVLLITAEENAKNLRNYKNETQRKDERKN